MGEEDKGGGTTRSRERSCKRRRLSMMIHINLIIIPHRNIYGRHTEQAAAAAAYSSPELLRSGRLPRRSVQSGWRRHCIADEGTFHIITNEHKKWSRPRKPRRHGRGPPLALAGTAVRSPHAFRVLRAAAAAADTELYRRVSARATSRGRRRFRRGFALHHAPFTFLIWISAESKSAIQPAPGGYARVAGCT